MVVAILGGSGRIGGAALAAALQKGHTVRALVRNPAAFPATPGVTVVAGSAREPERVAEAVAGAEAVVSSLGDGLFFLKDNIRVGTANVIEAMRKHGVKRLIAVSAMGVGDSARYVPGVLRPVLRIAMRSYLAEKEGMEASIRSSGLDWTIVRPSAVKVAPANGRIRTGTGPELTYGLVTTGDLGNFMAEQLTSDEFVGKAPCVTGA